MNRICPPPNLSQYDVVGVYVGYQVAQAEKPGTQRDIRPCSGSVNLKYCTDFDPFSCCIVDTPKQDHDRVRFHVPPYLER